MATSSSAKKAPASVNSTMTLGAKKTPSSVGLAVKTTLGPKGRNVNAKTAGITPVG